MTVVDQDLLAEQFETHRTHLRSVAYRMLGSLAEAGDAVQEAWLRLGRSDASGIENLGGCLTTLVARVCLNMLRSRASRREDPLDIHLPDPIVTRESDGDPEHAAVQAEAVGLALLVVLDSLSPAERIAFVLHDIFAMSFDEIAPIVGRSPAAARQLASRARRRVKGASVPDSDLPRQRAIVETFFAAARGGNLDALLAVLDPEVVVRADYGAVAPSGLRVVRGAAAVAKQTLSSAQFAAFARPAIVNGAAGIVAASNGRLYAITGFTISGGRILEIDILADPARLGQLGWALLAD